MKVNKKFKIRKKGMNKVHENRKERELKKEIATNNIIHKKGLQMIDCSPINNPQEYNLTGEQEILKQNNLSKQKNITESSYYIYKNPIESIRLNKPTLINIEKQKTNNEEIIKLNINSTNRNYDSNDKSYLSSNTKLENNYTPQLNPKNINNPNVNYYITNSKININQSNENQIIFLGSPDLKTLEPKDLKFQVQAKLKTSEIDNPPINNLIIHKKIKFNEPTNNKIDVNERFDRRGIKIIKRGNHRISFIDVIDIKNSISKIVDVESFKKYNLGNTYIDNSNGNNNSGVSCCNIY